ncbi:MAG: DUF5658 family protein [Gammaproteobacteria bacterium]|nr:DUF5658 family protein [Gammaproteobacteria bacterium]
MKLIALPVQESPTDCALPAGRRFVADRRQKLSTVNLRHLGLQGRRQSFRRPGDEANHYVDWYEPRLMILGLAIILCSCTDAFFTLNLLQIGAVEMNILMARLIETDVQAFVNAKIALTSLCVTLLVIHKNFRLSSGVTVEHLLLFILAGYITLLGYEAVLLANPPF